MKSKKVLIVAVTALVAVMAMVGAASALAGVWKKGGSELKEKITLSMTGDELITFEGGTSGLGCPTTEGMSTSGGSTASVFAFAVEISTCIGIGKLEGCTVALAKPKTLPWNVTVNTTTLTVKNAGVKYTMNTGCPISTVETNFPALTLTPEEPSSIVVFNFAQTGTGKVNGTSASVASEGAWLLSEADFNKYGIG